MATNFPTSVDTLVNPVSNDSLNSPSHSAQHANANDAIEAIENAIISPATYPSQLVNGTTATVRPLPFATQAGSVAITTSSGSGAATVTFVVGRFTQTPIVVASCNSPSFFDPFVMIESVSTSSVQIRARQTQSNSAATVTAYFNAVQMTSAAAAG
jgi:hypothetical protein